MENLRTFMGCTSSILEVAKDVPGLGRSGIR
jgi:hypothetical protein